MSWHVSRDGIDVIADTEEELAIAITVFRNLYDTPPAWVVGGPPDRVECPVMADVVKPGLSLVVPTESPDSVAETATVQHVSVSKLEREMFDAIVLFPEGVSTGSLQTLLGLTPKQAGGRVQMLKRKGLVEQVVGHWLWRATEFGRRAKVVAG